MKKRKLSRKKILLFIVIIIGVGGVIFLAKSFTKPKASFKKPKVISEINGYELKEGASSYYKNLFNDLKTELSKDEVDEENYAIIISQLFISDCFTLANKVSNTDVGGIQFVHEPFQDDFVLIAKETLYSHVENNIYGNRKQELPIVREVTITSIETKKYEYLGKEDNNAYFVKTNIEYTKDLGYPKEVSLIIIHNDSKLEIAELE